MNPASTLTREQVLDAAQTTRSAITDLEVEQLVRAVQWAQLHPGDEVDESAPWDERDLEVAGPGAPTVAEFAVAEFGLAIGLSADQGVAYVGDAVELCHRLPRTWQRVLAGEVVVWKARRVAQATRSLPMEAAGFVDRALASVLHRCAFVQIERTVEAARAEFDPAAAEERRLAAEERRHVNVFLRGVSSEGTVLIGAEVDVADGVAFEDAIAAGAAELDPAIPLNVRRAMALGMLVNGQMQRELMIYTHVRPDQTMVEVENTRTVITPEQLKTWCQQAGTKVTVRPVLDLNENLETHRYEPTPRQQEQVTLTFPTCVFPLCSRPSRRADSDHIIEYPVGRTDTFNLAPLCRGHHRHKTHSAWTYRRTGPRTFEWISPMGQHYVVDTDRHIR